VKTFLQGHILSTTGNDFNGFRVLKSSKPNLGYKNTPLFSCLISFASFLPLFFNACALFFLLSPFQIVFFSPFVSFSLFPPLVGFNKSSHPFTMNERRCKYPHYMSSFFKGNVAACDGIKWNDDDDDDDDL
jgi:hypothetical protein